MSKALMRSSMHNPLITLREFDNLFQNIFSTRKENESFPLTTFKETDKELIIQFALAGYPRESLKVEVKGDVLTVRGDKVEGDNHLFAGRAFTWQRRDGRGEWVFDKTDVKYENGALTLLIPRRKEIDPEVKIIDIK